MNISEDQYTEELRTQEIKGNMRTVKGFILMFSVHFLVWLLTIVGFFVIDKRTLSATLFITGLSLIPVLILRLTTTLSHPAIKYVLMAFVCMISSTLISSLTFHASTLILLPMLFAVQYRDLRILWFSFIMNMVSYSVSCYLGFYTGLCDLNILFQSSHNFSWYMSQITQINSVDVLILPFNENIPLLIAFFQIFPQSIILFMFTVLLQYIITSNYNDAVRIAELTYKKDRDSTTKLFNKLKYDEMCESYYPLQDSIAVSFWDLNSLKYVNDNFGHAMGDALIETFSSTIYESSSDRCSVYRIGGDEFLVVIDNPSENEMENEVIKIQQKLLHTHKSGGMKVSVAVGVDYGKGSDIQLVVKNADEKMYLDKKNQKEKKQ